MKTIPSHNTIADGNNRLAPPVWKILALPLPLDYNNVMKGNVHFAQLDHCCDSLNVTSADRSCPSTHGNRSQVQVITVVAA